MEEWEGKQCEIQYEFENAMKKDNELKNYLKNKIWGYYRIKEKGLTRN